ncbi:MAG: 2-dehydropantoate 2-reductase [Gaiellales bacterium]|nr:2-dehydropantoate 2-reductase [Gaiellales bacterium]
MRVAVVGAGAIGGYIGAALARGGADVVLIARGAHLEALRRDGIRVLSARGDMHERPEATDELAAIRGAELVVLGVKGYSLPGLARQIASFLSDDAVLLPAQNGVPWWFFQSFAGPLRDKVLETVDPGAVVTNAFEPGRVVGCVPYPATELAAPGVIQHIEGTRFTIGEPDGTLSDRCRSISAAFVAGGLKCPVEADIRRELWLKLIGNVAFNPATALTGATLGELALAPQTVDLARAVMEECAAVGQALGIELPVSVERRLEAGIAVGDHRTSMLHDLEAGKPLEIESLTGAVLEIAGCVGTAVPNTRALDALIRLRALLRDRPDAREERVA